MVKTVYYTYSKGGVATRHNTLTAATRTARLKSVVSGRAIVDSWNGKVTRTVKAFNRGRTA